MGLGDKDQTAKKNTTWWWWWWVGGSVDTSYRKYDRESHRQTGRQTDRQTGTEADSSVCTPDKSTMVAVLNGSLRAAAAQRRGRQAGCRPTGTAGGHFGLVLISVPSSKSGDERTLLDYAYSQAITT